MSLDQDLITFVKWTAGICVFFLVAFGGFIIWFFGVDVAQTRKAMQDAREDVAKRLDSIRSDHQMLRELKDSLQRLGAEMVDEVEKARAVVSGVVPPGPREETQPAEEEEHQGPLAQVWEMEERKRERIREVLATSEFEWSTVGTVQKKTKLPPDEVEALARNDPLVQVGHGRQGATLLRLKEFNFPGGIGAAYDAVKLDFIGSGNQATKAYRAALWDSAQQGRRTNGKVLGGE